MRASHGSSLVDFSRASLHSDMCHTHKTCLRLLLSEGARRIPESGAVYHSDVYMQLAAYEFFIQQSVHCTFASLDQKS